MRDPQPPTSAPPLAQSSTDHQRDARRLRVMLLQMPAVLWTTDTQLRFTSSDGAALGSIGWAPGQAVGMTVPEVLANEPTAIKAHHQAIEGKSVSYDATMNRRLFRSRVEPLKAEDGQVMGVIGVAQDVTERQQAEQEVRQLNDQLEQRVSERTAELYTANQRLSAEVEERRQAEQARHESERRLESILENTTAVVYLKDPEGNYLLINRQFERIFNVKREDVVGHGEGTMHPPRIAQMVRENDQTALHAGHSVEFEETIAHGGESHDYISIKFPLFNGDGRPYAVGGISTDITARKQAEQRARRHQQESAHAARLSTMGEMASGLAHELNQPLAAISNYVQGILQRQHRGQLDPDKLIEVFDQINNQSERAGRILRRLRAFVKKSPTTAMATDLNQVVQDALALAQHEIRNDQAEVDLDLADHLPPFSGEAIQIEQVILNLMRNALDASRGDDGLAAIRIATTYEPKDKRVMAHVEDNGIGISEDQQKRLFEPFFTTKPQGMGVGLNISQSIVEAHGGRLWAQPNMHRGMTFHISLPASEDRSP